MFEVDTPTGLTRITIDYQNTVIIPNLVQIRLADNRTDEDVWIVVKGEAQVGDFLDNIEEALLKYRKWQERTGKDR